MLSRPNHRVLTQFVEFLCKTWPIVGPLEAEDETGAFLDDWTQANWELLVESSITVPQLDGSVYLSIYRNGSDSVPGSSRVFCPKATANCAFFCLPKNGNTFLELISGEKISVEHPGLKMSHFVTLKNGWHIEEPPFDCVLLEEQDDTTPRVISVRDVEFVVAPYGGD